MYTSQRHRRKNPPCSKVAESRRLVKADTAGLEVWFLSRFCEQACASVMEPGLPRYRDRTCWSPKGFPHREIIRVVPRIRYPSLELRSSGAFLLSDIHNPSPGGKVARPSEARKQRVGRGMRAITQKSVQHNRPSEMLIPERKAGSGLRVSCHRTLPPAFLFSQKIGSEEPIF